MTFSLLRYLLLFSFYCYLIVNKDEYFTRGSVNTPTADKYSRAKASRPIQTLILSIEPLASKWKGIPMVSTNSSVSLLSISQYIGPNMNRVGLPPAVTKCLQVIMFAKRMRFPSVPSAAMHDCSQTSY